MKGIGKVMIIIFVSEAGNLPSSRYTFGPHLFKMKKMIDFSILLSIFSTSDGSSLSINFETMNENRENRCDFVANWTWEASSNHGYAVCNTTYPFYQLNDHKRIFFMETLSEVTIVVSVTKKVTGKKWSKSTGISLTFHVHWWCNFMVGDEILGLTLFSLIYVEESGYWIPQFFQAKNL